MKRFLGKRFPGSRLLAVAALAMATGLPHAGFAQAQQQPTTPPGAPPPTPAVPPPIASHADPKAPVPTNPPEKIAPPAKLDSPNTASPLIAHPTVPGSTERETSPATR